MTVTLNNYLKQCLTLFLFSFSVLITNAQTIKGKVFDAATGEPLVGATVKLSGTKYSTLVRLDGSYSFSKLPAGTYKQTITYTGYKEIELSLIHI